MEYTKDIVLKINYGQAEEKKGLGKVKKILSRHKMMTTIIAITILLMAIDFTLISSFVKILNNI